MMKWIVIVLTAIFTGLKLASVISWSWWLVLSPVIIYIGLPVVIFVVLAGCAVVLFMFKAAGEAYREIANGIKDGIQKSDDK